MYKFNIFRDRARTEDLGRTSIGERMRVPDAKQRIEWKFIFRLLVIGRTILQYRMVEQYNMTIWWTIPKDKPSWIYSNGFLKKKNIVQYATLFTQY